MTISLEEFQFFEACEVEYLAALKLDKYADRYKYNF